MDRQHENSLLPPTLTPHIITNTVCGDITRKMLYFSVEKKSALSEAIE